MAKDSMHKKGSRYRPPTEAEQSKKSHNSRTRTRVEHVFGVMKRQFGFTRVRLQDLDKKYPLRVYPVRAGQSGTDQKAPISSMTGKLRLKTSCWP